MSDRALRVAGVAFLVVLAAGLLGLYEADVGIIAQGVALGLGTGLMAVGLVLVYRTTRVINFGYGAMGTVCGALAACLRLGWGWSWWIAAPIGIAAGVLVGIVVEVVVIRRFRRASRLVLTVATIGLAQALGGLALFMPDWFGVAATIPGFETELTPHRWAVGSTSLDANHLVLALAAPVALLGLMAYLYRTEAGTAVRGMAENIDRARLLGIPVGRLTVQLWAIVGGLAALTVVLKAPVQGLPVDAASGPTILLAPLAAAVVAGMRSIWAALLAGIAVEVIDQLVQANAVAHGLPRSWSYVALLAVIVVALVLQRPESGRGRGEEGTWSTVGVTHRLPDRLARLPEVRIARLALLGLVVLVMVLIPVLGSPTQIRVATLALVSAIAALSLVVLTGWGGSVSLGQVALVGVGGLVTGNLIADSGIDLILALLLAAAAGGLVAAVVGIPALRVSGQLLAVSTLAFAVVLQQHVVQAASYPELVPDRFERPELFGRWDLASQEPLYVMTLVVLVAAAAMIASLRRTRTGRVIAAGRDNPRAASAVGVNRTRVTITAFVFSGVLAGLAGGIHAVALGGLGDGSYPASDSLVLFSMAVIGGISSLGGTLAGVALIEWLGYAVPELQLLLTGVGLLVILMVVPGGLGQVFERARDAFVGAVARRRGLSDADAPEEPGTGAPRAPAPDAAPAVLTAEQEQGSGLTRVDEADDVGGILTVRGVESGYGSLQVLFGIDAGVEDGQVLALLGTNGAGKSTLFKSIVGLLPVTAGRVELDGRDITGLPTEEIARLGLMMMPGGKGIFPGLTVAENMRMATWMLRGDRARAAARTEEMRAMFPVLADRWDQPAGTLSGGEQQQLSIAMAFVTEPRVVLIDELSLGLAPSVVGMLVDKVRELHRRGTTILVVEQSVNVALLMCERALFFEKGQVRFRGPTVGLLDRPDVLRSVFIGDVTDEDPDGGTGADDGDTDDGDTGDGDAGDGDEVVDGRDGRGLALACRGLTRRFGGITAVDDVGLTVAPGEVIGLIGHNGAGKTTLFDLLTGFLPADGGSITLGGRDITDAPPHRRAVLELGRSFQEALLFPSLTTVETIEVALERHLANRDPVAAALRLPASVGSERSARARADELLEMLGLTAFGDRPTGELSTGTRRIVELACLLAHDPAVVLLDEPTAGVAQAETEALVPLLRRVREATGCSLVVIEHDMAMLRGLCDRFVALEQGRVIAEGPPAEVLSDPAVISSYLGTDDDVIARSGARRVATTD